MLGSVVRVDAAWAVMPMVSDADGHAHALRWWWVVVLEMAYVNQSVQSVAFMCLATPGKGRGSTFMSDGIQCTEYLLSTPLGKKLKELGVCYRRNLTDRTQFEGKMSEGVYNHWQKSMNTEDPAVAEALAQSKGMFL